MASYGLADTDTGPAYLREVAGLAVRAECPADGCCDDTPECDAVYRLVPCQGSSGSDCGWNGPPPVKLYICTGKKCANGTPITSGVTIAWLGWCWTAIGPAIPFGELPFDAIIIDRNAVPPCATCGTAECSPNVFLAARVCRGNAPFGTLENVYFCARDVRTWMLENPGKCPTAIVYVPDGKGGQQPVCVRPRWDLWVLSLPNGATRLDYENIDFDSCCACLGFVRITLGFGTCLWDETADDGINWDFNGPNGIERVHFDYLNCCCDERNGIHWTETIAIEERENNGNGKKLSGYDATLDHFGSGGVQQTIHVTATTYLDGAGSFDVSYDFSNELVYCNAGLGRDPALDPTTPLRPYRGLPSYDQETVNEWTHAIDMTCTGWRLRLVHDTTNQFNVRTIVRQDILITRFGGEGVCGDNCGGIGVLTLGGSGRGNREPAPVDWDAPCGCEGGMG